ncbi:unnamed protein product, partial [Didymodactylos carnosus]
MDYDSTPGVLQQYTRVLIKECLQKSEKIENCDFIQCFHDRYKCSGDGITEWAVDLCKAFPVNVIQQFTQQGQKMMINIQNCTQRFLAQTYRVRNKINCEQFERKYFDNMAVCYNQSEFCQVFKENRQFFMKYSGATIMRQP